MVSHAYRINARLAAGLSALSCWLCLLVLAAVVASHHPDNHIALDIRVCYLLGGLAVAAALLGRAGEALSGLWLVATLASGVSLIAVVFVLDHWNLLVGYEVWLARGQPGFGQPL